MPVPRRSSVRSPGAWRFGVHRPGAGRRCQGLTLLEVALSAAILAGVAAGLLVARARAGRALHVAHEMMIANALVASQAAQLRAGLGVAAQGAFEHPAAYRYRAGGTAQELPEGVAAYALRVVPPGNPDEAAVAIEVWRLAERPAAGEQP